MRGSLLRFATARHGVFCGWDAVPRRAALCCGFLGWSDLLGFAAVFWDEVRAGLCCGVLGWIDLLRCAAVFWDGVTCWAVLRFYGIE